MSTNAVNHTIIRTAAFVFAADQLTKFVGSLNIEGSLMPVYNSDYSLGIVAAPVMALITLSTVTLVVAARYGSHLARAGRIPVWVPGVVVGGAASNLLDRLVFGAVRDFIPTPIVIFNVANIAVLCGLAVSAWSMMRAPAAYEAVDSSCAGQPNANQTAPVDSVIGVKGGLTFWGRKLNRAARIETRTAALRVAVHDGYALD